MTARRRDDGCASRVIEAHALRSRRGCGEHTSLAANDPVMRTCSERRGVGAGGFGRTYVSDLREFFSGALAAACGRGKLRCRRFVAPHATTRTFDRDARQAGRRDAPLLRAGRAERSRAQVRARPPASAGRAREGDERRFGTCVTERRKCGGGAHRGCRMRIHAHPCAPGAQRSAGSDLGGDGGASRRRAEVLLSAAAGCGESGWKGRGASRLCRCQPSLSNQSNRWGRSWRQQASHAGGFAQMPPTAPDPEVSI